MANTSNASSLHHSTYAGFWLRFFATCIDLVAYTPLYVGMKYAFDLAAKHVPVADAAANSKAAAIDYVGALGGSGNPYQWWFEGLFIIVAILSYAWFFSSRWQGTPGMHILRFHICDVHGKRITFSRGMYWIITSLAGWAICFAGIIYLQAHFDLVGVRDLRFSCLEQQIAMDDCNKEIESLLNNVSYASFMGLIYASLGLFVFLSFIWALSIALPKDKTGFHNLLCGTRFIKGRPPVSGSEEMPII